MTIATMHMIETAIVATWAGGLAFLLIRALTARWRADRLDVRGFGGPKRP